MSRRDPEQHAQATDPQMRRVLTQLRRLRLGLTSAVKWQGIASRAASSRNETVPAEPFTGIGIYARPPTDGNPEAIEASIGGADHPVLIALRDEKTRAKVAAAVGVDETMLFNSVAVVYIRSNGTVEIRTAGGVAVALALKSDVDNLRQYTVNQFSSVTGHVHAVVGAATTSITTVAVPGTAPTVAPPAVVGTTALKGQ